MQIFLDRFSRPEIIFFFPVSLSQKHTKKPWTTVDMNILKKEFADELNNSKPKISGIKIQRIINKYSSLAARNIPQIRLKLHHLRKNSKEIIHNGSIRNTVPACIYQNFKKHINCKKIPLADDCSQKMQQPSLQGYSVMNIQKFVKRAIDLQENESSDEE